MGGGGRGVCSDVKQCHALPYKSTKTIVSGYTRRPHDSRTSVRGAQINRQSKLNSCGGPTSVL